MLQPDDPDRVPHGYDLGALYRFRQWMGPLDAAEGQQLERLAQASLTTMLGYSVELGAMQRAYERASALAAAEVLLPGFPGWPADQVAAWRKHGTTIWDRWWPYRDSVESTSNYEAGGLRRLVEWIDAMGRNDEVYADRDLQRHYFDRFLAQVFPLGTMPHYGDTIGWTAWAVTVISSSITTGSPVWGSITSSAASPSVSTSPS